MEKTYLFQFVKSLECHDKFFGQWENLKVFNQSRIISNLFVSEKSLCVLVSGKNHWVCGPGPASRNVFICFLFKIFLNL